MVAFSRVGVFSARFQGMERTPAAILDALQRLNLLDSFQVGELSRRVDPAEPASGWVAALVERGWLTRYQGEQVLQGRERDMVLEPYILLKPLGRGGMGQVYQALHRRMKRVVALKVIRPELLSENSAVLRFHREIEAVARVSHPNIVLAYDAGEVQGTHFLVMEYVEGMDLARLLEVEGPLEPSRAVELARQVCLGLRHAHEQGLVHRDIKPSNLMWSVRDRLVKILDLGLARLHPWKTERPLAQAPMARLTPSGVPVGTPDYLAPEQLLDPSRVDIRSDLYSLGCTFYHLLAGRPPFDDGNLFRKLVAHREQEPPALRSLRPDLPEAVVDLIRTLMAKRPDDRYQSPAEVIAALEQIRTRSGLESAGAVLITPPTRAFRATPGRGPATTIDLGSPVLPPEIPDQLVPLEAEATDSGVASSPVLEPLPPPPSSRPRTPGPGAGALERGWASLQQGRPRPALAAFEEALADHPDQPEARLGRGQALLLLGEPASALEDLTRYLASRPRDAAGHYQRGLAWLARGGSRRKAIRDFSEAIRLDPGLAPARLQRGLAYARRRDDARAIADLDEAIRLEPRLAPAFFHRGLIHARHRRFEQAIRDYSQALELDPGSARAANNRGVAWIHLGRVERAAVDYREAIRLDPAYAVAHQNLGLALADLGEHDQAILHFGEALRLNPDLPIAPSLARAYFRRGLDAMRRGEDRSALGDLGMAIRIRPGLAGAYLARGIALARLDEPQQALDHYNEAIRLDPNLAQAYHHRAIALAKLGDEAGAEADRRIALRLDPSLSRRGRTP
jgi:serine/threonine protein kinase/lipoprotein NlpI